MERIIGRDPDGAVVKMLEGLLGQPSTAWAPEGFRNPSPDQLDRLAETTRRMPPYDANAVKKHMSHWIPGRGSEALAKAVFDALEPVRKSAPGTVYTVYAKLMCWLAGPLAPVTTRDAKAPCAIVSGTLSKHSFLMMRILDATGIRTIYFDPVSEDGYRKGDPDGTGSDLSEFPVRKPLEAPLAPKAPGRNTAWQDKLAPWSAVMVPPEKRSGDAVLAYVMGTGDRAEYRNTLFNLKKGLEEAGRSVLLSMDMPTPPTNEEIDAIRVEYEYACKGMHALAERIAARYTGPTAYGMPEARKALEKALSSITAPTLRKAYNRAVRTACWFARVARSAPSCLIRYGPLEMKESELCQALADAGCDVVWFDPEAAGAPPDELLDKGWTVPAPMTAAPLEPFPEAPERTRAETVAHAASRELDEFLYKDTGLYREHQFSKSQSITLKTTFDEVVQLWPEPPSVRPGFEADGETATVPCLFAKIAGVPDGNRRAYWETIRNMSTKDAYAVKSLPFLPRPNCTPPALPANCSPAEVDERAGNPYPYLSGPARARIMNAAAALCEPSTILMDGSPETRSLVLSAVAGIPQPILDLIQGFDPARNVPKVLVVSTDKNVLSRYECVMLALLNMIGLDVAVFEPTGYQDLERYVRHDMFDLIQAGPYITDMKPPVLKRRSVLGKVWDALTDFETEYDD